MKANPLISQNGIDTHNSSLKFDLNSCHPLSSLSHDPLPHDLLDQPIPNPNSDHVQGSHSSQVEEQENEDSSDLSSLFQNRLCQDYVFPSLIDFEYNNLGDESNEINLPNQSKVLGNHHSDDDDSIDVHGDKFPSAPFDISVSKEDFVLEDLDLKVGSVQENVLMETSTSPHYTSYSTFCNKFTCEEDTPCFSSSLSNELDFELTQGCDAIHEKKKVRSLSSIHPIPYHFQFCMKKNRLYVLLIRFV